jgi:hypothetical protein
VSITGTTKAISICDTARGFVGIILQKERPYGLSIEEIPAATLSERTRGKRLPLIRFESKVSKHGDHIL